MPGKLKPLEVERETLPGKYPDGDGLYLIVASATSKNWSYRYWKDGKQRWLGLGSVKDVSLSAQSQREQCQLLGLCSAGLDRRPSALLREHIVETQQTLRPASGALRGMSARAVELICQYGACACAVAPTSARYRRRWRDRYIIVGGETRFSTVAQMVGLGPTKSKMRNLSTGFD